MISSDLWIASGLMIARVLSTVMAGGSGKIGVSSIFESFTFVCCLATKKFPLYPHKFLRAVENFFVIVRLLLL